MLKNTIKYFFLVLFVSYTGPFKKVGELRIFPNLTLLLLKFQNQKK